MSIIRTLVVAFAFTAVCNAMRLALFRKKELLRFRFRGLYGDEFSIISIYADNRARNLFSAKRHRNVWIFKRLKWALVDYPGIVYKIA